ncbi:hypothetical protein [Streptomyces fulvoviolaceus]|uniref:hypothetical protein n=1 Tax=Streptomyces fulvoviolaceus TaxID=285535 RepID=UPI0004C79AA6|nr:hypothetical protein [Streptomyces fulvoviolaceus]MCT9076356.1 hypothetical protein [Streptomyces fulvoviolaceus]
MSSPAPHPGPQPTGPTPDPRPPHEDPPVPRSKRKHYALVAVLCSILGGLITGIFGYAVGHLKFYPAVGLGAGAAFGLLAAIFIVMSFILRD